MTTTVLVTGVGAPGTRGTLYSLTHNVDQEEVRIVGVDMDPTAVGRHWCEKFYEVPAPEERSYFEILEDVCDLEKVDVILPQTTREAVKLSRAWKSSPRACVVPWRSMRVAVDKAAFLTALRPSEFEPRTHLVGDHAELLSAASALGFPERPFVVKPEASDGSRGLRIVRAPGAVDWRKFISTKPEPASVNIAQLLGALPDPLPQHLLVQEYLPGNEYSVDCFRGSRMSVAVPRVRKRMVNGISFETTVELREDVTRACLEAADTLGLAYAFGFQMKCNALGEPKFIECNPRVQGSMVTSTLAGVNVVWMAVQEALGNPPTTIPLAREGTTLRRYWGGFGELPGGGALDV